MPYRFIYLGLGLLVVATIALGVAFGGGAEPDELPAPIERLSPAPGDAVLAQALIEIDLVAGYRAEVFVDGFKVPDSEMVFVEATGVHTWAPSATGSYLTEWTPGTHKVLIRWTTLAGLPDTGQFEWTFRVQ
ncbi:MAG TPA: hypothetical protein VJ398_00275 [Acidimicrobiia bacterium]|nr:hypothetical protein [Acidimicrobiia bacterium]